MVYTGMENALLTFQSHIIIGGDKSGMDNANHEITHSWSGNLVTNMNWDNFWLNEGIATFIQSKIIRKGYGNETAIQKFTNSNYSMYFAIEDFGIQDSFSSMTPRSGA